MGGSSGLKAAIVRPAAVYTVKVEVCEWGAAGVFDEHLQSRLLCS